jgi:serine/threonine protein kinase
MISSMIMHKNEPKGDSVAYMIHNLRDAILQTSHNTKRTKELSASIIHRSNGLVNKMKLLDQEVTRLNRDLQYSLWVTLPIEANKGFSVIGTIDHRVKISDKHIGKWKLGPVLGEGSFASVWEGVHITSHESAAIKFLDKQKVQSSAALMNICLELSVLQDLGHHQNIIGFKGFIHALDYVYLMMERANKDLVDLVANYDHGIPTEDDLREIAYGILMGLIHLHENCFCHRDLKPENVLVCDMKPGIPLTYRNIRIADFGLGAQVTSKDNPMCKGPVGTPGFCAPEMFQDGGVYDGYKADSWSFGCLMLEMVLGPLPFEKFWLDAYQTGNLQGNVMEACQFVRKHLPDSQMSDFIKILLNFDPCKRGPLFKLKEHEWFDPIRQRDEPKQNKMHTIEGEEFLKATINEVEVEATENGIKERNIYYNKKVNFQKQPSNSNVGGDLCSRQSQYTHSVQRPNIEDGSMGGSHHNNGEEYEQRNASPAKETIMLKQTKSAAFSVPTEIEFVRTKVFCANQRSSKAKHQGYCTKQTHKEMTQATLCRIGEGSRYRFFFNI